MQWNNTCLEFSLKFLTNIISCLISLSSLQCKRLGAPLEHDCRLAARANICIQIESSTQLFTLVCSYSSFVAYHSQRRLGFELGGSTCGIFFWTNWQWDRVLSACSSVLTGHCHSTTYRTYFIHATPTLRNLSTNTILQ